jgi:hypothetical protein
MTKKIIAAIMSVILCFSLMMPVFAEDGAAEGGFNLDINDILSSDIMQEIMQNENVIDLTGIILDLVVKLNADALKEMGKEEAEKFIQSTVDTIAGGIMMIVGNKDLIITYDPLKVMGNLFDLDTEALTSTTNPSEEEEETKDPNELTFGLGDVDGDGKLTAADARRILRRAAKLTVFTMEEEKRADVDYDGKITAKDARKVLRVVAQLDTFEEVTESTPVQG